MPHPIRIALVIASTREQRLAPAIASWTEQQVRSRGGFDLDVVDLAEASVPSVFPTDPASTCAELRSRFAWADAFVLVVPEYNHSFPAPLKQALDVSGDEWSAKPVAFVSYGGRSGGLRAVEQLRPVVSELRGTSIPDGVSFHDVAQLIGADGALDAPAGSGEAAAAMLDELLWWARTLRGGRELDRGGDEPGHPEGAVSLFVTHRALPGRRDDVRTVWDEHLRPIIEANPDHLSYTYGYDALDPDVIRVAQTYRSAAAKEAFLSLPGYDRYLAAVLPLVATPPELTEVRPMWSKQG